MINKNRPNNKMMITKQIGIWMDHARAHLMVLTSGEMETNIIESTFTHEEKKLTPHRRRRARRDPSSARRTGATSPRA